MTLFWSTAGLLGRSCSEQRYVCCLAFVTQNDATKVGNNLPRCKRFTSDGEWYFQIKLLVWFGNRPQAVWYSGYQNLFSMHCTCLALQVRFTVLAWKRTEKKVAPVVQSIPFKDTYYIDRLWNKCIFLPLEVLHHFPINFKRVKSMSNVTNMTSLDLSIIKI